MQENHESSIRHDFLMESEAAYENKHYPMTVEGMVKLVDSIIFYIDTAHENQFLQALSTALNDKTLNETLATGDEAKYKRDFHDALLPSLQPADQARATTQIHQILLYEKKEKQKRFDRQNAIREMINPASRNEQKFTILRECLLHTLRIIKYRFNRDPQE